MSIEEYLAEFKQALFRLKEATDEPENPMNRDATIQRFEFTYELAWKLLKRYLQSQDVIVNSPKAALQIALQHSIIQDGSKWTELQKNRNLTVDTYDETLAHQVYQFIQADAVQLFSQLLNISS